MATFEFQQAFDGTQPEVSNAEQEAVRAAFNELISDTLLKHIESVEASPLPGYKDYLFLYNPEGYPNAHINIFADGDGVGPQTWLELTNGDEISDYLTDSDTARVFRYTQQVSRRNSQW